MKNKTFEFTGKVVSCLSLLIFVFTCGAVHADGAKDFSESCMACHQANGAGIPGAYPALANDPVVNGDPDTVIKVVLLGPAQVLPASQTKYSGVMPSFAQLSDAKIAAILTYVRSSFGNTASAIDESQVTAVRSANAK